jgi:hypothetical protein
VRMTCDFYSSFLQQLKGNGFQLLHKLKKKENS